MPVALNHTIVAARDKRASAAWFTEIFGLAPATPYGPFMNVNLDNGVSLDFLDGGEGDVTPQHYAFLVGEHDFDEIFGRIRTREIRYWADPHRQSLGEINTHDGGRGVYFEDPNGHLLEIITRPYGSGS
jgi:catechol 2,3-dioxygenase-like lactoylglutathione lyase family enzyme